MTLKEIEKIIDEADFYLVYRGHEDKKRFFSSVEQSAKKSIKNGIEYDIKIGCLFIFFKFNDNYEVENRWVVDHIDPEKKIVRKKLNDMTPDELYQLEVKYPCKGSQSCFDCPLNDSVTHACLIHFAYCKKVYENNKDKEFEVEVEE